MPTRGDYEHERVEVCHQLACLIQKCLSQNNANIDKCQNEFNKWKQCANEQKQQFNNQSHKINSKHTSNG